MKVQTWGVVTAMVLSIGLLTGCKPRNEPVIDKAESVQQEKLNQIPLIQSKTVTVELAKPEVCVESGCTQFNLQTVNTNVDWINEYFDNRIKKTEPIAFSTEPNEKVNLSAKDASLNQSSMTVRYMNQWYNIATFVINSYTFNSGAAHGLSHAEYVNFDLTHKKRISLQDILIQGVEGKVINALYDANSNWLNDHSITREKLQLSDNFYYGADGIVFVYPLYELASYAEGMTELVLPYQVSQVLIKPEYLPSLPNYKMP
ncbi:RsiV family protein [Acinetobacter sp. ANC 4558]|uniref:RsiV family protein n=1 Tax=Acinetobacter sp. ANC 4558 TaxID=1977876 RepID=UPI003A0FE504